MPLDPDPPITSRPLNLRIPGATDIELPEAIEVDMSEEPGEVFHVENDDGSVTVSIDDNPLFGGDERPDDTGWFANLADKIGRDQLSTIAENLLRGIRYDEESRRDLVQAVADGIKLLGLKLEVPSLQGASDGAPVEGMSKVRHPLLLESVLRFNANARSELLPTDGPVKIRNDDTRATLGEDEQANALEKDLNHYLTAIASEYYPDTDRMLLYLGFGGTTFKKVYYCPMRMRPVSESVEVNDLIVNNDTTDLKNAKRITHRIYMQPNVVKRLQILGIYRDVELGTPQPRKANSIDREEKSQQGVAVDTQDPMDRDREIYEVYCNLDIKGYEHKLKGKVTGLEIPYRVTIDVSSREILSIVRNYDEDSGDLPEAREVFVQYLFVPGFGFYGIGLLHILGNTTNAVTAAWRIMLDNGMYANFPGFLISKEGTRQNTSVLRVPPGGGAPIDTGGKPINQAVMPLPYQTTGMASLMALEGSMVETGQRVGGTSELQVGEGRADAPVGTTLALIEQAVKVMNAVHKRMCTAQAQEFKLIVDCFREHPESFCQHKCKYPSNHPWDEKSFIEALNNCNLMPQADPNTASSSQRMMKIMALKQLQAANPPLYDAIAIDKAALRAIGYGNPEEFMAPPEAQQQPPPQLQEAQAKLANESKKADATLITAKANAAQKMQEMQNPQQGGQVDTPVDKALAQAKLMDAETKRKELHLNAAAAKIDDVNRDQDRHAKMQSEVIGLANDIILHPQVNASAAVGEAKSAEDKAGQ